MKSIFCLILLLVGVSTANAQTCFVRSSQIVAPQVQFINAGFNSQVLVNQSFVTDAVLVPESVSFFAHSHPTTFVTNRVINNPSFFSNDFLQSNVIAQPVFVRSPFISQSRVFIRH